MYFRVSDSSLYTFGRITHIAYFEHIVAVQSKPLISILMFFFFLLKLKVGTTLYNPCEYHSPGTLGKYSKQLNKKNIKLKSIKKIFHFLPPEN